jgi:FkbM family methyltransferase
LRTDDTVIDVGANVGYFSAVAALQVGDTGSVYTLEANPSLAWRLRMMATGVPDGPIRVTWAAAWRETGTVTLKIDKKWSGWSSLVENPTFSADEAVEVEAITIDGFIAQNEIGPVRLLKLDIEGAETDALLGATHLLEKHQADIIQIETDPHRMRAFGHHGWQLAEMMSAHGYQPIAVIQNEAVRPVRSEELTPGSVVGDYIFVHSSVADEIVPLLFGGARKS